MKTRIIDNIDIQSMRLDVDKTWENFSHLLVTAFGDLLRQYGHKKEDVDMVYCPQRMRSYDEKMLDSLVYNIPPAFIKLKTLFGNEGETEACKYIDEQIRERRIHWAASKDAPFLLLGHIGIGKSTFLDHYFCTHMPEKDNRVKGIIINFKTAPDSHEGFIYYLLEQVEESLNALDECLATLNRDTFDRLFADELASIKSSLRNLQRQESKIDDLLAIYVDCKASRNLPLYQELVKRKLKYLKETKNLDIWIVVDNIDQHFYCLHHRAFVNAISIAYDFKCPLIIAMRYITLATPGARETYDSYRPRRLKLSLPDIPAVIDKRLRYFNQLAKDILEEPLKQTGGWLKVKDLMKDVSDSINLLRSHAFLFNTLIPLSNYNLRRLLDMLLASFQSYYFYFDRFNNERYIANIHTIEKRFLYSHMLKNSNYYDPEPRDEQELFIVNMFENENKDASYNQTIRFRILQALLSLGRGVTVKKFVSSIKETFDYDVYDILQALQVFHQNQLFAIRHRGSSDFGDVSIQIISNEDDLQRDDIEISSTYSGRLHFSLLHKLEYVEIMKLSTYVYGEDYAVIQAEENQETYLKRKRSTLDFVAYLAKEESQEIAKTVKNTDIFHKTFGHVIRPIEVAVRREQDELEARMAAMQKPLV